MNYPVCSAFNSPAMRVRDNLWEMLPRVVVSDPEPKGNAILGVIWALIIEGAVALLCVGAWRWFL